MALSANLKARLEAGGTVAWLVDVALPSGTRRYALHDFSPVTPGHYEGKLLSVSPIADVISDRTGGLQAKEITLEIDDTDRTLAALIEGASGDQVIGSAVTVRVGEIGTVEADWSTRFTGVIADVGFDNAFVVTIRARTDDLALRRKVPKGVWYITSVDWPSAKPDLYGTIWPLVYGTMSMTLHTDKGALKCPYVDTTGYRYLVCAGRAKAVDRVYKDGVLVTSGYSVVNTTVNGKAATLLDFTASQGESVITADVQGYEATGDGSGALIETPTGILAHLLSNFVFGDYRSGNWLSTSSRLDSLTAVATFFSDRGYTAAFALTEVTTGADLIQLWLATFEARAWWTGAGKLAFGVQDPTVLGIYPTAVLRHDAGFSYQTNDQAIVSSLTASFAFSPADNKYIRSLEVAYPDGDPEAIETLALPFGGLE